MYFNGYRTKLCENYKGNVPEGMEFKLYSQNQLVIPDYLSGIVAPHRHLIETGVEFEIKEGYSILIYGRNALSSIHGISLLSTVVVTPQSYDEVKIVLVNLGEKDFVIKAGDVVANGIVFKTK